MPLKQKLLESPNITETERIALSMLTDEDVNNLNSAYRQYTNKFMGYFINNKIPKDENKRYALALLNEEHIHKGRDLPEENILTAFNYKKEQ